MEFMVEDNTTIRIYDCRYFFKWFCYENKKQRELYGNYKFNKEVPTKIHYILIIIRTWFFYDYNLWKGGDTPAHMAVRVNKLLPPIHAGVGLGRHCEDLHKEEFIILTMGCLFQDRAFYTYASVFLLNT